ncbi:phytanoyl-CoA dioxygenase family protein [Mucisphaera calidilacus]|uniref:Phytanoyl-CoA dioxygenase (PhyH) n=1 Tax=Mucisphaera calidilacus TaxID=2527982 RepID=A0A518BWS3_9BACT|nr:phytanoyl-CoA dioxygenase family protein [Mucisphaera calidilacus]QDU71422.1 Phytanoyl-CoA dioxygenase (PhyH) [Mucisphaera calidilacus]
MLKSDTNVAEFYAQRGYYIADQPVIPADTVHAAEHGMEAVRRGEYASGNEPFESPWKPGDDDTKLCKIEMPNLADPDIHACIAHPALGELAARVTGAKMIQVWWVQLLHKPSVDPANAGGPAVGWHQDAQYWPEWTPDSELFTAWVAISDVTPQAGPMAFVPGSHRDGLFAGGDFFSNDLDKLKNSIQLPQGIAWEEVPSILKPGGVSFHHRHTLHGSGINTSGSPRKSFAIHLRTEKSTLNPDHERILTQFIDDHDKCPVIYDKR